MADQRFAFGAGLEGDHDYYPQFSLQEMERIAPEDLLYCMEGYDEMGYWQSGFIQGRVEEVAQCEVYGGYVSRRIGMYRDWYGDEFVARVMGGE